MRGWGTSSGASCRVPGAEGLGSRPWSGGGSAGRVPGLLLFLICGLPAAAASPAWPPAHLCTTASFPVWTVPVQNFSPDRAGGGVVTGVF